jgi:hypothetical protein
MILELKHGYRPEPAAPAAAWMSQIASDMPDRKVINCPNPSALAAIFATQI